MRTQDPIDLEIGGFALHDPVVQASTGADDDPDTGDDGDGNDGGTTADPGGDSDPDVNEGFEPKSD